MHQVETETPPGSVLHQLDRILASRPFLNAQRSQRLLRYLVENWIKLPDYSLKEYTIAIDVFDRDPSYDPSIDAAVRVEAGRLRTRLKDYYTEEGKEDPLIIELPKGAYRITVTPRPASDSPSPQTSQSGASETSAPESNSPSLPLPKEKKSWPYLTAFALACLLILAITPFRWTHHQDPRPPAKTTPISIAILPFTNATGDKSNTARAEGLTENLIRQSSELPHLRVMSFSAVANLTPANAASHFKVDILIIGALRKDNDGHLTVNAEISNARDGSVIHSHRYLTEQDDLQPVQADIVSDLIHSLGLELDARQSASALHPITSSHAAFEDFLRGEDTRRQDDPEAAHAAIKDFEAAVKEDPNFALAWSALAEMHTYLGLYFEPPAQHLQLARKYAQRAISIDSELASAHASLGVIDLVYDWNLPASRKELSSIKTRRIAITQLACTAHLLQEHGKFREAREDIESSLDFDPRASELIGELGCIHYYAGENQEAERDYRRALAADPHSPVPYWGIGKCLTREGRYSEALKYLHSFKTLTGIEPPMITAEIGYTQGVSGDHKQALETMHQLKKAATHAWVDPYFIALIYHSLKDREQTYLWLDKAYQARSTFLISLLTEPKWEDARNDPEFVALINKIFQKK